MSDLRIAHGLLTWQDGRELLERCLRSTAPHVDHILIAEGLIDGVPNEEQLSPHSDLAWMAEPSDWLPAEIPISSHGAWPGIAPWRTLSDKCNWMLGEARRRGCDWFLLLDADEELHNGDRLRAWLEAWPAELAAFPIPRRDGPVFKRAPWHLLRVPLVKRYVHGVGYVELTDGRTVWLVDEHDRPVPELKRAPWISHHPELRPPWRRSLRLGEWETRLEPQPDAPSLILPVPGVCSPEVNAVAQAPRWYCPGCGKRYPTPGMCNVQHPATELAEDTDIIVAPGPAGYMKAEEPAAAPDVEESTSPPPPVPAGSGWRHDLAGGAEELGNVFTTLHRALDDLERLIR